MYSECFSTKWVSSGARYVALGCFKNTPRNLPPLPFMFSLLYVTLAHCNEDRRGVPVVNSLRCGAR